MAIVPKVLPGNMGAITDIGPTAVRQALFGISDEARMPQSQQDARRQNSFPIGLGRDNLVHQREKLVGVVLYFDIHVKFGMEVFRLRTRLVSEAG